MIINPKLFSSYISSLSFIFCLQNLNTIFHLFETRRKQEAHQSSKFDVVINFFFHRFSFLESRWNDIWRIIFWVVLLKEVYPRVIVKPRNNDHDANLFSPIETLGTFLFTHLTIFFLPELVSCFSLSIFLYFWIFTLEKYNFHYITRSTLFNSIWRRKRS